MLAKDKFYIVAIINKKTVLVNAGKRDGVRKDNSFDILDQKKKTLKDPITGEILDKFYQKKQRIYVSEVHEKYSVCVSTYTTKTSNLYDFASIASPLSDIIGSNTVKTEIVGKELNVEDSEIEDLLSEFNYAKVKVGDIVKKVD